MTSKSVERGKLNEGKAFGKKLCSRRQARLEITMLTGLVVEQGRQCGFASRS